MGITIRPFIPADAEPVDSILQALWTHDPTMLEIYRWHRDWPDEGGRIRRTLVAESGGEIAGTGTIFESRFHPLRLFLNINVAPHWQHQGIGSALYDALAAFVDERPWQVKMTRRDKAGMRFLTRRGYKPAVTSLTGLLDPRDPAARRWAATLPVDVSGYRILNFADPQSSATLTEVALTLAAVYRQYHQWNPPVEEDAAMALAHHCGSDVIPGSTRCVYQGDNLIGAANLFIDPAHPGEDYLGNSGIVGLEHPAARSLTAALIRCMLDFAAGRGRCLRFEADDTYVPQRAIFETAPASETDRDFVILMNG